MLLTQWKISDNVADIPYIFSLGVSAYMIRYRNG